jgi:hypothetical protein
MKKLPIGKTDNLKNISKDYIYVEKTRYIYDLLGLDYPFFLSRPRRFGKTLLVSTLGPSRMANEIFLKGSG